MLGNMVGTADGRLSPPRPVMEHVPSAGFEWTAQSVDDEANTLMRSECSRLLAICDDLGGYGLHEGDMDVPQSLAASLDINTLPQQLSAAEKTLIQKEARTEPAGVAAANVAKHEQEVLDIQLSTLEDKLRAVEETKLTLELSLARLERVVPTHHAWLKEQKQKYHQLEAALLDPGSITAPPMPTHHDLHELEAVIKRLAQQNADAEQEGLIKSLNACHAMEMLTTSLKYQNKWRNEALSSVDSSKKRLEECQRAALAEAREEENVLKQLHDVTAQIAESKKSIALVHRRLLGAAPLPNGTYMDEKTGAALMVSLKAELARGSTRLLEELAVSMDFNVLSSTLALQQTPSGMLSTQGAMLKATSPPPRQPVQRPDHRNVSPHLKKPQASEPSLSLTRVSPPPVPPVAAPTPVASSVSRVPSRSGSAEEHRRIQVLQEEAQRQLQGITATLKGLAVNAGVHT